MLAFGYLRLSRVLRPPPPFFGPGELRMGGPLTVYNAHHTYINLRPQNAKGVLSTSDRRGGFLSVPWPHSATAATRFCSCRDPILHATPPEHGSVVGLFMFALRYSPRKGVDKNKAKRGGTRKQISPPLRGPPLFSGRTSSGRGPLGGWD